jgi:two-component system, LytTR family, response regulator LytT
MQVFIIEDEKTAADRLIYLLREYDPSIVVSGTAESIEEAVQWLNTRPMPDLILMDIQLADGYSFDIFKQIRLNCPIIFTTAYDQYALEAFRYHSIDYILKPVTAEAMARALNKLKGMSNFLGASNRYEKVGESFTQTLQAAAYKDRFLARIGQRIYLVKATEIAWFEADNKIVHLIDREGDKYLVDYTLEKLSVLLDPAEFVRINRRFIIHHHAVDHMKPHIGNRMQINLVAGKKTEQVVVSRDRVTVLKEWA